MNRRIFEVVWGRISCKIRKEFNVLSRFPTEKNGAYVIGYITALNSVGHLSSEDYSYLLALAGQVQIKEKIRNLILEYEVQP